LPSLTVAELISESPLFYQGPLEKLPAVQSCHQLTALPLKLHFPVLSIGTFSLPPESLPWLRSLLAFLSSCLSPKMNCSSAESLQLPDSCNTLLNSDKSFVPYSVDMHHRTHMFVASSYSSYSHLGRACFFRFVEFLFSLPDDD
jgi:hypothetical protein